VGCTASGASQYFSDGQLDFWQTAIGCTAGAVGAAPVIRSTTRSAIYGGTIAIAEGLAGHFGPPILPEWACYGGLTK
jgi:hypothetical protein